MRSLKSLQCARALSIFMRRLTEGDIDDLAMPGPSVRMAVTLGTNPGAMEEERALQSS